MIKLTFVGVGTCKAGTTWLSQCLAEHPEICLSIPKELNFFSDYEPFPGIKGHWGKSNAWLEQHFRHAKAGQILGEYSPMYVLDTAVPDRLRHHNPDMKILISYREPIGQLHSFYHQLRRQYPVPDSFEGFLETNPRFLQIGHLARQTRQFLEVFPRGQIHFVLFDDIQKYPHAVLRGIHSFLNVQSDFRPPSLELRINERAAPRSIWLRDGMSACRSFLNSSSSTRVIKEFLAKLGAERMMHQLLASNLKPTSLPPIAPSTRQRLHELYDPEISELARLMDRDISHWLHSTA